MSSKLEEDSKYEYLAMSNFSMLIEARGELRLIGAMELLGDQTAKCWAQKDNELIFYWHAPEAHQKIVDAHLFPAPLNMIDAAKAANAWAS